MEADKLQTYTRLQPYVLAVQMVPGVEDNWIAVDPDGRILSRASTLESVRTGAPQASDYAPVLDLPGLEDKPLKMGDYVINDGDGVYWVMAKDAFEELFAEGEQEEKVGKGDDSKAVKELRQIDELLGHYDGAGTNLERIEAMSEDLHRTRQKLKSAEAAEPIVVVEKPLADDLGDAGIQAMIEETIANMRAAGATFSRVTISDDKTKILFEGWATQPDEQGETRWARSQSSAAKTDPLDHDGDGKKGGAKKLAAGKKPATGSKATDKA